MGKVFFWCAKLMIYQLPNFLFLLLHYIVVSSFFFGCYCKFDSCRNILGFDVLGQNLMRRKELVLQF
jgi:hypothetical protein